LPALQRKKDMWKWADYIHSTNRTLSGSLTTRRASAKLPCEFVLPAFALASACLESAYFIEGSVSEILPSLVLPSLSCVGSCLVVLGCQCRSLSQTAGLIMPVTHSLVALLPISPSSLIERMRDTTLPRLSTKQSFSRRAGKTFRQLLVLWAALTPPKVHRHCPISYLMRGRCQARWNLHSRPCCSQRTEACKTNYSDGEM